MDDRELLRRLHDWFLEAAPEHYAGCGLYFDVNESLAAAPEPLRVAEKDVRSVLLVADHALHEAYLAPVNLTVADYIDNARTRIKALLALLPTPDQPKPEVKDV